MTYADIAAIVITCAGTAGYLNDRFVRLPASIGQMLFALILSLAIIGASKLGWIDRHLITSIVGAINFPQLLLHFMLGFLLFAGALNIPMRDLRRVVVPVGVLATVGVVIATFITGTLTWYAARLAGLDLPYLYALLFGALISPTDPIAVLSILRDAGASRSLYIKVGGESLFNDGVGVSVFLAILGAIAAPTPFAPLHFVLELLWQGGGGLAYGLGLGWIFYRLLRVIDDYKVEVMMTMALVAGGYVFADFIGVSGPIAMVAAGLVIGNQAREHGMSANTRRHLDVFWELVDEILNAILFLLIGLQIIVIPLKTATGWIAPAAIAAVLIGRFVSVAFPIAILRLRRNFEPGTVRLLTWGGLRGGISIAMALSLPDGPEKAIILPLAYIVVIFAILVQGLTFRRVVRVVLGSESTEKLNGAALPSILPQKESSHGQEPI